MRPITEPPRKLSRGSQPTILSKWRMGTTTTSKTPFCQSCSFRRLRSLKIQTVTPQVEGSEMETTQEARETIPGTTIRIKVETIPTAETETGMTETTATETATLGTMTILAMVTVRRLAIIMEVTTMEAITRKIRTIIAMAQATMTSLPQT
ncbi:hypothetical protein B0H11DRAFT_2027336 [Mycena galericulata]|nr:hypothetical protein B0H11DRAFT_2027336 [Mycena galericulata]